MWHDVEELIIGIVRWILYMAGLLLLVYFLAGIGARNSAGNINEDTHSNHLEWSQLK